MPLHNQLNRGNWSEALKRSLGATKSEGGIERYGETLTPVINLWSLPEWAFLRAEYLFASSLVRAADAANMSVVGVMLPVASKNVLIIDSVSGRNSTATGNLILSMVDRATIAALGGFALANPPFLRDQRAHPTVGSQAAPVETFTALSGVTVNGTMENLAFPTTDDRDFRAPPLIVRPGGAAFVQGAAINQQIVVEFVGRVRPAQLGEL